MPQDREIGSIVALCPRDPVLKLLLFRGLKTKEIKYKADLFDSAEKLKSNSPFRSIDPTIVASEILDVNKPRRGPNAEWAKILFLDTNGREIYEGMIIEIKRVESIPSPVSAAGILRMLGFYNKDQLVEGPLNAQNYLNLYLALTTYQRSNERMVKHEDLDAADWTTLSMEYGGYEDPRRTAELPALEFPDKVPELKKLFTFKLFRGKDNVSTNPGKFRLNVNGYYPDIEIRNGSIEVQIPFPNFDSAKHTKIYCLDDEEKLTGEGLILNLTKQDTQNPQTAGLILKSLGFYDKDAPAAVKKLSEQDYLNLYLALSARQRAIGTTIRHENLDETDWEALNKEYGEYDDPGQTPRLPDLEFDDRKPDLKDLFAFRFFRGKSGGYPVGFRINVNGYRQEIVNSGEGLEAQVPITGWGDAGLAKVYYLDNEEKQTGEGLILDLKDSEDAGTHQTAGLRLKSLGFYDKKTPAAEKKLSEQDYLNLYLALTAYRRSKERMVKYEDLDEADWKTLDKEYGEYNDPLQTARLPDLEFDDREPDLKDLFAFRFFRGKSDGYPANFRINVNGYRQEIVNGEDGLDAKVPQTGWGDAVRAKVYYLDDEENQTGEGLILDLKDPEDAVTHQSAGLILKSLGFYDKKTPAAEKKLSAQDYLNLYLALTAYRRSKEKMVKYEDLDEADWKALRKEYAEYDDPRKTPRLPDLEFSAEKPEDRNLFALKLFRGKSDGYPRNFIFKVNGYSLEIKAGEEGLESQIPQTAWGAADRARIYYLDDEQRLTGEGLILDMKDSAPPDNHQTAGLRLKSLGFYDKESPAAGKKLSAQDYLNLYLALTIYQRFNEKTMKHEDLDKAEWEFLSTGYEEYEYSAKATRLPDLEFEDQEPNLKGLFTLKLFRGEKPWSENAQNFRINVNGYILEVKTGKDGLEIQVPKTVWDSATFPKVYYLDDDEYLTGEGLILNLNDPEDVKIPRTTGLRLKSLGFYDKEPPALGKKLSAQDYLNLYLALTAHRRSNEKTIKYEDLDEADWTALHKECAKYNGPAKTARLPELEFDDQKPELKDLFTLKLFRGEKPWPEKAKNLRINVNGYIPEIKTGKNGLEIQVPKTVWDAATSPKVYYLDDEHLTGEGLILTMNDPEDVKMPRTTGLRLKSLGFYDKEPPALGKKLSAQDYLNLYLALTAHRRSNEKTIKYEDLEDADWTALHKECAEYDGPGKAARLPDLEFDDRKPELKDLFTLKLFRGESQWPGNAKNFRININGYIPEIKTGTNGLEIQVPKTVWSAESSRVYYLDDDEHLTGEGLILTMNDPEDVKNQRSAALRLKYLGFYDKEPPPAEGDLSGQDYLNLYLALAAYQRFNEKTLKNEDLNEFDWKSINAEYEAYENPRKAAKLPDLKFD